jgi:hypothetical protein
MPFSNANVNTQELDLGPCRVTYGGLDLGATMGNVAVKIKYSKADMKMDQTGTTIVDKRVSGLNITIESALAQVLDKNIWKKAFPTASLVTSGLNTGMLFDNKLGLSSYAGAQPLVLHPLNKADADKSNDYNIYKAYPTEESDIVFGPTEQQKLKIVWAVFPDVSQSGYPQLFIGDPTVGLISASAAAAVPGSNTGNGTVTGITVFSGFTATETVTLTCVGVPGANQANFSVSGSVSGAHGVAAIGVGFSCPQIAFTINDGATDFVIGDSFTIATTAANYG